MAFNWARLAAGQKVTNVELREEAAAKAAAEQKIESKKAQIRQQQCQERQLRTKQADLKREQARETARIAEEMRQKERAESLTREKGHWCFHTYPKQYEEGEWRDVDREFNERVVRWVQEWFTVWGDVLFKLETLDALEQKYYEHWCPWLLKQFSRDSSDVERYITQNAPSTDGGIPKPSVQYKLIQQWVTEKERQPGSRPWEEWRVWTPAKHITWAKVSRVLTKKSTSFEKGIVTKGEKGGSITWNVVSPYKTIRFKAKPLTRAQQERKQKEDFDDIW
jgi:hypothetical protein